MAGGVFRAQDRREQRAIRSVTLGAAVDPVTCPAQDVDVRSLISSLPPRLRDPFLLHYGGFGIREVAVLLRKPEGAQGRPVRRPRQAEDDARGTRWLSRSG
jgi:DNA-directed RNA polymerase specialized sigma24 family protein